MTVEIGLKIVSLFVKFMKLQFGSHKILLINSKGIILAGCQQRSTVPKAQSINQTP